MECLPTPCMHGYLACKAPTTSAAPCAPAEPPPTCRSHAPTLVEHDGKLDGTGAQLAAPAMSSGPASDSGSQSASEASSNVDSDASSTVDSEAAAETAARAAPDAALKQSLYGSPVTVESHAAPSWTSTAGGAIAIKQEPGSAPAGAGQPAPYWVELRGAEFSEEELDRWGSTVAHASRGMHSGANVPLPVALLLAGSRPRGW